MKWLKTWQDKKPELFLFEVNDQAGLDTRPYANQSTNSYNAPQ